MQAEHKKVLLIIFCTLFALLFAGTTYITVFTQNIAIAGVLVIVCSMLMVDIMWVAKSKREPESTS